MSLLYKFGEKYYLALAAIALYNNWVVGMVINWPVALYGASISELSVAGQPGASFFRACDALSGILLIYSSHWLATAVPHKHLRRLVATLIAVIGLGNIIDATIPLKCVASFDAVCAAQELTTRLGIGEVLHITESILVAGAMLLLPTVIVLSLRRAKRRQPLYTMSILSAAAMFTWFIDSGMRVVLHKEGYGYAQRLLIIVLSLLLLTMANVVRKHTPPQAL